MTLDLASSPLELQCEWCGAFHTAQALCTSRPKARGMSRRSFVALFGAGVAGYVLAPTTSGAEFKRTVVTGKIDIEAFGKMTAQVWNEIVRPFTPDSYAIAVPGGIVITDSEP